MADAVERLPTVWEGYVEPAFGQRILARLIDGLLVVAVGTAIYFAVGRPPAAMGVAVVTAYEVWMVTTRGQTLGKMAMGVRIVDAATGEIPSLRQAALRWLVVIFGGVVERLLPGDGRIFSTAYDIVILLPILKPPYHRGIHDRVAGTIVTATDDSL